MEPLEMAKFLDVLELNTRAMDIYARFNDNDTEFRIMWVKNKIGMPMA
jgi:hypothetical protein